MKYRFKEAMKLKFQNNYEKKELRNLFSGGRNTRFKKLAKLATPIDIGIFQFYPSIDYISKRSVAMFGFSFERANIVSFPERDLHGLTKQMQL